ncbi:MULTISPECIES: ExbD/TolR family protein [Diaphorobacter]|uniref:Cell division and transport-associated protein TolR n=2 Tax=Diaphorobacter nitroreducens TaxID=164759 RepID=A0AAX1WUV5_9BURK|nr:MULTISPECIES: ExbD/TolR family protein [Diaphorobacter]ABM42913.1 Cell division and transport-associated protein TolR [Acidovorax sp. JS42]PZU42684.1 MAG: ExbD/TolR family protein [Acidovorax sp.]UOB07082.1 ExbD/TolR family protein [Diaphorobacter sp. LI3]ASI67526.1 protein TolR [Diaphorobacter nitroreducens]POR09818.1 protein TolR [Diaphorobacter sp. LR2014-1]
MPAMASRSGTRRRSMNEINMVPFIDVMLVLLIIFMVTAPMLTPSSVNVPSVGKGAKVPKTRADVIVDKDGSIRFKADGNERTVPLQNLGATAKNWLKDQPEDTPVLISADKNVSYDAVMKAMSALQQAGVARVALAVKSGG